MKKGNYLLLSAALLIVGGLFAATGAATGLPPVTPGTELFPPASGEPPRTCNLGTKVTIVAGLNGDPIAPFPRVVSCPSLDCPAGFSGSGQYLRWDYAFMYYGVNPSHAYLSVSVDTNLFFTTPAAMISPSCPINNESDDGPSPCELRFIRFNANSSTFNASYLTSLGWSPRIATAGAKAGKYQQFCLLAGAGKPPTAAVNQAITEEQTVQTAGCRVSLTRDPNGRVAEAEIVEGEENCSIEVSTEALTLNGKKVVSNMPEEGWTTEGSCNYNYTNTYGGKTTISCSTCCVKKSTNTCVLKSSLTSPTTQCTAGSL